MKSSVYVFDPTASDKQSAVRGVGRYLQILKENFTHKFKFVSDFTDFKDFTCPSEVPSQVEGRRRIDFKDSVFINPFFNFLQPPLLMKRIAKRQIAIIHDLIPLKYPEHFPAGIRGNVNIYLNKLALKNYDLIVTDSQASKKDIIQILRVEESRVKVVYPCLSNQLTNHKSQMTNDKSNSNFKFQISNSFCLYVGDATWNKNLVNLGKAIKIINVPCVFVGKVFLRAIGGVSEVTLREPDFGIPRRGSQKRRDHEQQFLSRSTNPWLREFEEFAALTKNDKRFIFAGYLNDYKLVKLYQQARVNILVSRDEGFGFSYLEAANFGCPSVLSDTLVLHEISNNRGAIFANPNDPNDIANKIGEVYFSPDLRNKLTLEAQQRAKFFSQDIFVKSWKNLI